MLIAVPLDACAAVQANAIAAVAKMIVSKAMVRTMRLALGLAMLYA